MLPSDSGLNSTPKKILLQVTGSIAAFKAVVLASKLVQGGYDLEVVLTEGAEKFVGAASFEGLTRKAVYGCRDAKQKGRDDLFETGRMMAHIDLERWADLILVYPATANTIATFATGRSDSLISAIFLAHEFKKPYWIAPAMNQAMLAHPATREHLEKLRGWGVTLLDSDTGALACGEIGQGRLVEPEAMLEKINQHFASPLTRVRNERVRLTFLGSILITSGGTTEPIDAVRSITNFSTGETGDTLATSLAERGYDVTLIQSRLSRFQTTHIGVRVVPYTTTAEFADAVKKELSSRDYTTMIHAAAVADYHVEAEGVDRASKIQKNEPFTLKLVPNEKVLKSVKAWSKNPKLKVISFKLTVGDSDLKLDSYDSDWVVHNDLKNVQGAKHSGTVYQKSKTAAAGKYEARAPFSTKRELVEKLAHILKDNTV